MFRLQALVCRHDALPPLTLAFETLACNVVGRRTDNFNFASRRAIRNAVLYRLHAGEWLEVGA